MFENNDFIKLKELQRTRRNKLNSYEIDKRENIKIDQHGIDILIVYFDELEKSKTVLPRDLYDKINFLKTKIVDNYINLENEDIKLLNFIINNYRYDDEENQKIVNKLIQDKDEVLKKEAFIEKYNVQEVLNVNSEENTKLKKTATFKTKSRNIDITYINQALDHYIDAWRLYNQHYQGRSILLEFNDFNNENRYWNIHFSKHNMPHLLGLPSYNDYQKLLFVQKFSKSLGLSDYYVVNDFLNIINDNRQELIEYEINNEKKFNWEKFKCKTIFFKNLGIISLGDTCVFKFQKLNNYYLLKNCANKNQKEYIELEMMHKITDKANSLIPKSIRLTSFENTSKAKIFLGLTSNLRHEFPKNVVNGIENNDRQLFDIYNYLILNQEKLYGSANLICECGSIFDTIFLKDIDLNYLFASFDYDTDQRKLCSKEEKQQIKKIYGEIRNGQITIPRFKEIINLARKVKLNANDNTILINKIKQYVYLQNKEILNETEQRKKQKVKNLCLSSKNITI